MASTKFSPTRREVVAKIGAVAVGASALAAVAMPAETRSTELFARATAYMQEHERWIAECIRVDNLETAARNTVQPPASICRTFHRQGDDGNWVEEWTRPMLPEEINATADAMAHGDQTARWEEWRKSKLTAREEWEAKREQAVRAAAGPDHDALDAWTARLTAKADEILRTPAQSPADVLGKVLMFAEWTDGFGHLIDGEYHEGYDLADNEVAVVEIIRDLRRMARVELPQVFKTVAANYQQHLS